MEVLDLFFNFRFNTRLERFIDEFKKTHLKSSSIMNPLDRVSSHSLTALLHDDYDIYENSGYVRRTKTDEIIHHLICDVTFNIFVVV